jgi:hypothetical protein
MINHPDSFSLLAELAMALAGFSGVAAAFSGRDRSYQSTEFIRLLSLFFSSGVVFAGSGAVYVLLLSGFPSDLVFRIVSLFATLAYGSFGIPWTIRAYRAAREPGSTSENWALHLTSVYLILVVALMGSNVFLGQPYLLLGAFWILLTYGLWMFSRLLTRAN